MIEPKRRVGRSLGWLLAGVLLATLGGGCSSCSNGASADAKADASSKSGSKSKRIKVKKQRKHKVRPRKGAAAPRTAAPADAPTSNP